MPISDFETLSDEEVKAFTEREITSIDLDGDFGYLVLVGTRQVRPEVAEQTDKYPLIINHMEIRRENLSPYSRSLLETQGDKYPV